MVGWVCAFSIAFAVTAATPDKNRTSTQGKVQIQNSSEVLAASLRRKLMKDNYDYTSTTESEDTDSLLVKRTHDNEDFSKNKEGKDTADISSHKDENVTKIPRKHKTKRNNFRLRKIRKKIKKYMNSGEEELAKRYRSRYRYNSVDEDTTMAEPKVEQSTTITYKILKIKHPFRRNGQLDALIQEESPQGVSIVNLGTGPFPEFRLPPQRRQYMAGPQTVGNDEEELPPPPLSNNSDEDTNETSSTQSTIAKPNNNEEDSFKVTVISDDILIV